MAFDPTFPQKLIFAILPEDAPNPTFVIRRKGGVKVVRDYTLEPVATALVIAKGGEEYFATTSAQRRSIQQLCRVILHNYALCEITFKSGISPWMEDFLYQAHTSQSFYDLMWEPHIKWRKYSHFRRPLHPLLKERR